MGYDLVLILRNIILLGLVIMVLFTVKILHCQSHNEVFLGEILWPYVTPGT